MLRFSFCAGREKERRLEGGVRRRYGGSGGGNLDKGREMGNINVNVRSLGVR